MQIARFVYVATDAGFRVDGYMWLAAYFISIVTEMVFVKSARGSAKGFPCHR